VSFEEINVLKKYKTRLKVKKAAIKNCGLFVFEAIKSK